LYPAKDGKVDASKYAHDQLVAMSKNSQVLVSKEALTKQLYESAGQEINGLIFKELSNK
jgi:hypothetical protein